MLHVGLPIFVEAVIVHVSYKGWTDHLLQMFFSTFTAFQASLIWVAEVRR